MFYSEVIVHGVQQQVKSVSAIIDEPHNIKAHIA